MHDTMYIEAIIPTMRACLCVSLMRMHLCVAQATEEKNARVLAAERTASKMALADRLINGLAGENKRWGQAIVQFTQSYGPHLKQNLVLLKAYTLTHE